ncbi:hypothetical protein AB6A40_002205 [Gnathostoma spinigerum]
MSYSLLL